MPFDAGGNFTRVHNWQEDRDNGIRIMADRHDEEDDNLANGLNQAFLRTGTTPMGGNLQMNGHRVIDVAAGTLLQPGLTFELDNDTGYTQPGSGQLGVVINQTLMGLWTADGLDVHGAITVDGIDITGGGTIGDNIDIPGYISAGGNLNIGGDSSFTGSSIFTGAVTVDDNLIVTGAIQMQDVQGHWIHVNNIGEFNAGGGIWLKNTTAIQAPLDVTGLATFAGGLNSNVVGISGSPNWYIGVLGANSDPLINFDGGDYFQWEKATNKLYLVSGGVGYATFENGRANFQQDVSIGGAYFGNDVHTNWVHSANDVIAENAVYARKTGNGGAALIPGGTTNTGYLSLIAPDGSRKGYIGFIPAAGGGLAYQNETGGNHQFAQNIQCDATMITVRNAFIQCDGTDAYIRNGNPGRTLWLGAGNVNVMYINESSIGCHYPAYFFNSIMADNGFVSVRGAGGAFRIYDRNNDARERLIYGQGDAIAFWQNESGDIYRMEQTTFFPARGDVVQDCGRSTNRWNAVWCRTTTNTVSDLREKDWRGGLSPEELLVAADMAKEIGIYRWLNEVEAEGDEAKLNCGVAAQKVIASFEKYGLNALDYAFVRHDVWDEIVTPPAMPDGEPSVTPAGDRYSVMLPDLIAFMLASQEQRIQTLEAMLVP